MCRTVSFKNTLLLCQRDHPSSKRVIPWFQASSACYLLTWSASRSKCEPYTSCPPTHHCVCVCVCAPVYDEHKDDCHPQSCVWVKKIYIFREVWIRFTSLGRNPRKQPATEISVMKNKNTYLMCQRGTVDPTPGKWKWEDGCKGHRCYLFFFFLLPQVFITPLTDPKAHIYLGQTCFWMWTVASESLTPLFFSKHFYFLFLLNLNGWIS